MLTHMGGPGTMCIDEIPNCQHRDGDLPSETQAALKGILSPAANIGHPPGYIDLTAAHFEHLHHEVLKLLFKDPNVDGVIRILAPSAFLDQPLLAQEIASAYQSQGDAKKPLLNVITFGDFADSLRRAWSRRACRLSTIRTRSLALPQIYPATPPFRQRRGRQPQSQHRREAGAGRAIDRQRSQEKRRQSAQAGSLRGVRPIRHSRAAIQAGRRVGCARAAAKRSAIRSCSKWCRRRSCTNPDIGGVMLGVGSDAALEEAYARLVENVRKGGARHRRSARAGSEDDAGGDRTGARRDPRPVVRPGGHVRPGRDLRRGVQARGLPAGAIRDWNKRASSFAARFPAELIAGARGRKPMNVDAIAVTLVSLGRSWRNSRKSRKWTSIPASQSRTAAWRSNSADHPLEAGGTSPGTVRR